MPSPIRSGRSEALGGVDRIRTPFGAFLRDVGAASAGVLQPPPKAPDPIDRSDWPQLLEPVTPIPGESLRSVVARSCRANHLPNSFGLLQRMGLVHRNRVLVSEDPAIDPAQLAWAMRINEAEVEVRRYHPLNPGHLSFFGLDVNARRLDPNRRRFSPMAFGKEDGEYPHHHRAVWELRDVPFCLENWDMLQDTCFCEREPVIQRWSRTATRVEECDKCGDPLAWIEPIPVPEHMRSSLSLLRAIVEPTPAGREKALGFLPEPLRHGDRSTLFRTVLRLASAIDPSASDHPAEDPGQRLHALHSACTAVRQWPNGLSDVKIASGIGAGTKETLQAAYNKLAHLPQPQSVRPSFDPCISEELTKHRQPTLAHPVGIRRATEIALLSPEVLTEAWSHGLVTRHERRHGDRVMMAFDPIELVILGRRWRERREPASLGREIGIPRYGIEDIAAHGGINADGLAIPGTGPYFTSANVQAFLEAFEQAQQPITEPVMLADVMRTIGGRLKPWGAVFDRLLDGRIPFDLSEGTFLIDRIRVERSCAAEIVSLHFNPQRTSLSTDTMVQNDALEVLNISGDLVDLLAEIPSSGRNPRIYRIVDVEKLAAAIVSVPEIAARLSMIPAAAYQELRRRNLHQASVLKGAWSRSVLLDLS